MIGQLPRSLTVNGISYDIRTDFRDCLLILQVFDDVEMSKNEQFETMLDILYYERESIPYEDTEEAVKQAVWFLNCGGKVEDSNGSEKRVYDWEQDEQMIFSAVNKVAFKEVRECEYVHFWTFISYFYEMGEGLFTTVTNIRSKRNKHKKLEKHEQEFWDNNRSVCELKKKYSPEERARMDYLNKLFS